MNSSHLFTHRLFSLTVGKNLDAAVLEGPLFVALHVPCGALGDAQRQASVFVLCLSHSSSGFVRMFFTSCIVGNLMNLL